LSEQPSSSSANPARAALVLLTYRNVGIDKRGASRLASPFAKRVFSFRARPCRARLYRRTDCIAVSQPSEAVEKGLREIAVADGW
ncbi:hypothetical protein QCF01_14240, partial [Staphylococcus aureus]|nr:hypothetical protein [Staphylococcus aureus]